MRDRLVTAALLALAGALVLTGLFRGQEAQVMAKAGKLCLECVGLG